MTMAGIGGLNLTEALATARLYGADDDGATLDALVAIESGAMAGAAERRTDAGS